MMSQYANEKRSGNVDKRCMRDNYACLQLHELTCFRFYRTLTTSSAYTGGGRPGEARDEMSVPTE